MLDAPVDAWYVWVGLVVVAGAALGTVVELPTGPPPDAGAAVASVDRVAAADHDATGCHPVAADAVKVEPHRLSLRDGDRTARAVFAYGPVVPVRRGSALRRVLRGYPPESAFEAPGEFRAAATRARDRPARWTRSDRLLVRTVTWRGADVTLVGA